MTLIEKYEMKSKILTDIIYNSKIDDEYKVRASVARRFVRGLIDDLKKSSYE